MQILALTGRPLIEQNGTGIFPAKEGAQGLFEGAPEEYRCAAVLLLPAVEVAMLVSLRTGQVLADLGVAVGHFRPPADCPGLRVKVLPNGRRQRSRQIEAKRFRHKQRY